MIVTQNSSHQRQGSLTSSNGPSEYPILLDFGLSALLLQGQSSEESVGSVAFLSPEIVTGARHSFATDVWSLGIVFYILLTGRFPFLSNVVEQTMQNIAHKPLNFNQPFWEPISKESKNLIYKMLTKDPQTRITPKLILESSPWLNNNIKLTTLYSQGK